MLRGVPTDSMVKAVREAFLIKFRSLRELLPLTFV